MSDPSRSVQVVWFERDLRVRDHLPLTEAVARGRVVCVYVYEPEVLSAPVHDPSHLEFVNESLVELDRELRLRGGCLTILRGPLPAVFESLYAELGGFDALWSHEKTGLDRTRARDRRVAAWCRERGVRWTEVPQTGVVRGLRDRDGWAARWRERMTAPLVDPPERIPAADAPPGTGILGPADLGLPPSARTEVQTGGETLGRDTLSSFLAARSVDYQRAMSSPVTADDECSRLSPHLAYGTLSMRTVYQNTVARRAELKELRARGETLPPTWLRSLASFEKRLRWHCHFSQKLDDQPELEWTNMARVYDGLREDEFDPERLAAWSAGRTGFPMVDACMRALHATGWINFRMRAMLVSFASYHLWLHWTHTAEVLARLFLDFEPGIHYPQMQMQSGVTGINTLRIYSPIKQVQDQDPHGVFLRRWLPELEGVPDEFLPRPETMPHDVQHRAGCVIGRDYPAPIVDHTTAVKQARSRIWAVRRTAKARAESQQVVRRHGSRRRPPGRRARGGN